MASKEGTHYTRSRHITTRSMTKTFIMKDVFPDEIMLLVLEYFLYDPEVSSGWKKVKDRSLVDRNDDADFWSLVEPVPGLLSHKSNMRDTLRSVYLGVNTVPVHLRLYFKRRYHLRKISLEHALLQHPPDYLHVRSLILDGKKDLISMAFLEACQNLQHIELRTPAEPYWKMINRHRAGHRPPNLYSPDEEKRLEEHDLIELHRYPRLRHIEMMATSRFWPENQGGEWAGCLDALKAVIAGIADGFADNGRTVKIEIIRYQSDVRGETLWAYEVV